MQRHTPTRSSRTTRTRADLSVGIVLIPNFTMLAFAGFLDTLRLAADESDRSRPIRCRWRVMTADGRPVQCSAGVKVAPTSGFVDASEFDYLVVVGGVLHDGASEGRVTHRYLRAADRAGVPLVGLCTGSLVLARAGLMRGRRTCVSWLHADDFAAEFPALEAVCDRLYLVDRDRITCAGGTSVIHLASMLVDRHCGARRSEKGLKIMIEEQRRQAAMPQPARASHFATENRLVRRALMRAEQQSLKALTVSSLADQLGTSRRHLEREFQAALGRTPRDCLRALQVKRARSLVTGSTLPMTEIGALCGFSSPSHFSRAFRAAFGRSPRQARLRAVRRGTKNSLAAAQLHPHKLDDDDNAG